MGRPRVEPSAVLRAAALETRANFLAYMEAGFTEAQAMQLTTTLVSAVVSASITPPGSADQ